MKSINSMPIPIPPLELRTLVGPTYTEAFDNPTGQPILDLPAAAFDCVLDFGCGCGRLARQLMQQADRPNRYIGIDVHQGMIRWCQENLTPLAPNFTFFHHDVYAGGYAPTNTLRLADAFPVEDGACSLVLASSVFTHLFRRQTVYYLRELARVLSADGIAHTSWFFFDRASFPFLEEGPFCLFSGEEEPTEAAIYDRHWFLQTVRELGLGVLETTPPYAAGFQWQVRLGRRTTDTVDQFPLGEDGAEWLCGATLKPMAHSDASEATVRKNQIVSTGVNMDPAWLRQPPLFGPLAELAAIKQSRSYKLGQALVRPLHLLKQVTTRPGS